MVRIAAFCVFFPLAVMEVLFYHHFGLVLVGSLYIILALQAERAANRLLASQSSNQGSKARRHWSEEEPEQEIPVAPLGEKRRFREPSSFTPPPPVEERPIEAPRFPRSEGLPKTENTPFVERRKTARSAERKKELPPAPNFQGRAHEILGVSEDAATRTIVNAFRHWIKRFHPDRARGLPVELANLKAQRIKDAKELLLSRRRAKRAA